MTVKKLLYKERKGITMDTIHDKKLIIYGMGKLLESINSIYYGTMLSRVQIKR